MSGITSGLIYVIEDEIKIASLLRDYLQAAGFTVACYSEGQTAFSALHQRQPDLILLDWMLPGEDGLSWCQRLRQHYDMPVIMLTARIAEHERLLGLEAGADDYVCKPFSPREVVARVQAQLRRARGLQRPQATSNSQPTRLNWQVLSAQMQILYAGRDLQLTAVEFRLLATLMSQPERVYQRQQLIDQAYPLQHDASERAIDSHIKNLRKKILAVGVTGDCLQSVYGVGYRFIPLAE